MAFTLDHVHLRTQDPKKTAEFYVENLGATVEAELGATGQRAARVH